MANEPEKDNKDNLEDILNALRHEQVTVREQAIRRLNNYANAAGRAAQNESLSGMEAFETFFRVHTQQLQQPAVVEALLLTLEDSSERIRAKTAIMLRHIATPEVQVALMRHLRSDPAPGVRLWCVEAIRSDSASPVVVDALIAALQDADAAVTYAACIQLGERADLRAVEPLRAVLTNPAWKVRYHACKALVQLHAVDHALVSLLEELNHHPEAAQYNASIIKMNESQAQFGPECKHTLTMQDVLSQARRALQ